MSLTNRFRLVIERYDEGRRDDYDDAHLAFISKFEPICFALGLPKPRMGNDAFFNPASLRNAEDDHYAFRLQLILAKDILPDELSRHLSLAILLNESFDEVVAWVEPMNATY